MHSYGTHFLSFYICENKRCHRYVYTAEDVANMVEKKRAKGEITNFAKEKSRLEVRRAKALEDGKAVEAEE